MEPMNPIDHTRRQPYGTREGDKWLESGSPLQLRLIEEDGGIRRVVVHEMMVKDGELQECVYLVDMENDPDNIIREAIRGEELMKGQRGEETYEPNWAPD